MPRSTWEEPTDAPSVTVPILTIVLRYDDLLADPSTGRKAAISLESAATSDAGATLGIGQGDGPDDDLVIRDGRLLLDDRWASGRHASLRTKEGGTVYLEDGGSRNGTWINGERVEGRARLHDGDLIEIGHTLLCFRQVDRGQLAALERGGPTRFGPTATRSPELAALWRDLERIARSRQPVLLLGETGVGKEIAASAIHQASGRRGAFCAVDCGAVPESLFEATFFGHRRGAFTGATEPRAGEIARADGGTLLLDEVGNTSLACQAKLLRAIEQDAIVPLGGAEPQRVDVRWIAATNADPFADAGGFRGDLVHRLAAFVARIPPLRRRREDLGLLAAHALREAGVGRARIAAAAGRRLFAGAFPGNVRQLRATLQTAAILAGDGPIEIAHLPSLPATSIEGAAARETDREEERPSGPPDAATIEAALARTGGNVIRAAALLDARPRQVYRWIERHALPLDRYRAAADRGAKGGVS